MNKRNVVAVTPLVPAVIIALLAVAEIRTVFEPPFLLPALNTVFLAVLPLMIAFTAARVFTATGNAAILLLGAAMMSLGTGGLFSGWLLMSYGGPNATITVYNCGVLLSALFHFAAGLFSIDLNKIKVPGRVFTLAAAYTAPAVFLILLSAAAARGLTPVFIVQGQGPTGIGQTVLNGAIILLAASYCIALRHYLTSGLPLFLWYSTGIGLFAVGLTGVLLQEAVGSPIGWAGRVSQYAGAVYFLAGLMTFKRSMQRSGFSVIDAVDRFFKDAEANYKALVQNVRDGIISLDGRGRVLLWNTGAEAMFGYGRDEAEGRLLADLIRPERCDPALLSALSGTGKSDAGLSPESASLCMEALAAGRNGARFPVEVSISRRETPDGAISTCIIRDISERKKMEDALRENMARFEHVSNTVPVMLFDYQARPGGEGRLVYAAPQPCREILELDPAALLAEKDLFLKMVHPEDLEPLQHAVLSAKRSGGLFSAEIRIITPSGRSKWIQLIARPDGHGSKESMQWSGFIQDVTRRKQIEIDLSRSLKENESLLKEIHHRVKNNLQIVMSLLGLQATKADNAALAGILEETRNRVRSMAILHEALYRSGNFADIDFGPYITRLCDQIVHTYGQLAGRVSVAYRLSPAALQMDQAVPCALIVNEMLSNALKHGFPDNRSGSVAVTFQRTDDQTFLLSVQDDGIGITADIDPEHTESMGMILITELTKQLCGRLSIGSPGGTGTEFRVTFPVDGYGKNG